QSEAKIASHERHAIIQLQVESCCMLTRSIAIVRRNAGEGGGRTIHTTIIEYNSAGQWMRTVGYSACKYRIGDLVVRCYQAKLILGFDIEIIEQDTELM